MQFLAFRFGVEGSQTPMFKPGFGNSISNLDSEALRSSREPGFEHGDIEFPMIANMEFPNPRFEHRVSKPRVRTLG